MRHETVPLEGVDVVGLLVINLKTAKALGLTIPQSLLRRDRLEDLGAPIEPGRPEHAGEQRLDGGEAHGVAALEQRQADGDREVGLAETRRPDETERVALGDEAIVEIAQKDLAAELGAQAEIEVVERLLEREGGILRTRLSGLTVATR